MPVQMTGSSSAATGSISPGETLERSSFRNVHRLRQAEIVASDASVVEEFRVPQEVSVAVFDLNGTIALTESAYREAMRRACGELLGSSIDRKSWGQVQTAWYMSDMLAARTVLKALRRMGGEFDLSRISPKELIEQQKKILFRDSGNLPITMVPGAKRLLSEFKTREIPLGLSTGSTARDVEAACRTLGVGEYFQEKTFAVDLPHQQRKPHPQAYLLTLLKHGIDPSQRHCLAFENSVNGALSAYQAGLNTVVLVESGNSADFLSVLRQKVVRQELDLSAKELFPYAGITLIDTWSNVVF